MVEVGIKKEAPRTVGASAEYTIKEMARKIGGLNEQ